MFIRLILLNKYQLKTNTKTMSQQLQIQSVFQSQQTHKQDTLLKQQHSDNQTQQKQLNGQLNEYQSNVSIKAEQNPQNKVAQKQQEIHKSNQPNQIDREPFLLEDANKQINEKEDQHDGQVLKNENCQENKLELDQANIQDKQSAQDRLQRPNKDFKKLRIRLESEEEHAKNTLQSVQKQLDEENNMLLELPQPPKNRDQQSFYYGQAQQQTVQQIVHFQQFVLVKNIELQHQNQPIQKQQASQGQIQLGRQANSFSYQVLQPRQQFQQIVDKFEPQQKAQKVSKISYQTSIQIVQKQKSNEINNYISNKALLQKIKILEDTVAELKVTKSQKDISRQQLNQQNQQKQGQNQIEKKAETKKKKILSIHDQAVYDLVQDLTKAQGFNINRVKKQAEKKYRRRIDLSSLMEKDTKLQSNVFNLTVGQIIHRQKSQQKDILLDQIQRLRKRVQALESQNKSLLSKGQKNQSVFNDRDSKGQSRFSHSITPQKRKELCGKLIKKSELMQGPRTRNQDFHHQAQGNETPKGFNFRGAKTAQNFFRSQRAEITNSVCQKEDNKAQTSVRKSSFSQRNAQFRVASAKRNNSSIQCESGRQNNREQKKQTLQFNDQQKIDIPDTARSAGIIQMMQKQGLQSPNLPRAPTPYDSQEDLLTIAKVSFAMLGVDFDQNTTMQVKKYKNCVHFSISADKNIVWYFDTLKVYFGGWNIYLTGEGEKKGYGFQYFPNKYLFKGYFKQGKRNGIGMLKNIGGSKLIYIGEWKNGIKDGYGKQIEQSGIVYKGQWSENKRHGKGQLIISQKQIYEGMFNKGLKNGYGQETFKNGDRYLGNYLNGKFNGKGCYQWSNGSSYNGQFAQGSRNGSGYWRTSNDEKRDQYEGQYLMDKKHGKGIYRWSNGSEYEGGFLEDLKHGQGIIRYDNGKVANFLWQKGQPVKKLYSPQQSQYRIKQKSNQKGSKMNSQIYQNKYNLKINSFHSNSKQNPQNSSDTKNIVKNSDKYSVYRTMYKTRNLKPDSLINIQPITNKKLDEPAYQQMKAPFSSQRKAHS